MVSPYVPLNDVERKVNEHFQAHSTVNLPIGQVYDVNDGVYDTEYTRRYTGLGGEEYTDNARYRAYEVNDGQPCWVVRRPWVHKGVNHGVASYDYHNGYHYQFVPLQ